MFYIVPSFLIVTVSIAMHTSTLSVFQTQKHEYPLQPPARTYTGKANSLLVLLLCGALDLCRTSEGLLSVLTLLALLSAGLLNFRGNTNSDQSVMGLEFLQCLRRIVDESETSGLSATELCLETEDIDLVLVRLVKFGNLSTELLLGDVGTVRM